MRRDWWIRRPLARVGLIVGGVILAAVLAFVFGLVVMLLWNWIMPTVFGLKTLTYWQSWGLVLLAHILFKAVGARDHGPHRAEEAWKQRFRERFRDRFEEEKPTDAPEEA
jgi:predicted membrane chloride channel (bestrophin family)